MPDSNPTPDFSAVRGVYFDLDDTLCGYWDASKAGLRAAFAREPISGIETEDAAVAWAAAFRDFAPTLKTTGLYAEYLRSGEPTRTEQMRLMLRRLDRSDEEHATRLSRAYMEERDARLALFPDARTVLDELKRRSYPLGLITNGPADIQRQEIATLGIADVLGPIFIEGELGFGKPVAEVFRRAAEAMALPPEALLMVGNSFHHDIIPAIRAGWRTAWVRRESDVPPSADVAARGAVEPIPTSGPLPDLIFSDLAELLPLLPGPR